MTTWGTNLWACVCRLVREGTNLWACVVQVGAWVGCAGWSAGRNVNGPTAHMVPRWNVKPRDGCHGSILCMMCENGDPFSKCTLYSGMPVFTGDHICWRNARPPTWVARHALQKRGYFHHLQCYFTWILGLHSFLSCLQVGLSWRWSRRRSGLIFLCTVSLVDWTLAAHINHHYHSAVHIRNGCPSWKLWRSASDGHWTARNFGNVISIRVADTSPQHLMKGYLRLANASASARCSGWSRRSARRSSRHWESEERCEADAGDEDSKSCILSELTAGFVWDFKIVWEHWVSSCMFSGRAGGRSQQPERVGGRQRGQDQVEGEALANANEPWVVYHVLMSFSQSSCSSTPNKQNDPTKRIDSLQFITASGRPIQTEILQPKRLKLGEVNYTWTFRGNINTCIVFHSLALQQVEDGLSSVDSDGEPNMAGISL